MVKKTARGNAVYVEGSGTPLIVVGGGPGFSSRLYRDFLRPLAQKRQLVFWDFGSVGLSEKRAVNSFSEDWLDLLGVVEHFKFRKIDLFGHSYGSVLALKYAIEMGVKAERLILAAGAPAFLPLLSGIFERKKSRLSPAEMQKLAEIRERLEMGQSRPDDGMKFCEVDSKCQFLNPDQALIRKFAEGTEFNLQVFAQNQEWVTLDFTQRLAAIKAKTLVLTSINDVVVPPEASAPFVQNIPNVREVLFEHSSHWVFAEEPEKFIRAVDSF
jgi:proline iminopeptidase